jgi:hypothetical protein
MDTAIKRPYRTVVGQRLAGFAPPERALHSPSVHRREIRPLLPLRVCGHRFPCAVVDRLRCAVGSVGAC